MASVDEWAFWLAGSESVRVLGRREHWGHLTAEVFVPSLRKTLHLRDDELASPSERTWRREELIWRVAAAKAVHILSDRQPLAMEGFDLEALPHQIAVLDRALELDDVRLLLADEVGLGKTIEAGLIYSELKLRGAVRRVLVVAPKGVQLQWVAEMKQRFGEDFARVGAEGVPVDVGIDPWRSFDRVVCSLDSVKPLRKRAGWSPERIDEHNERRFNAIVEAGWDLVIFDEAHHVAGSEENVARHVLARELARTTRHVLLLSATPHSGKSEAFTRLLGLLDPRFWKGMTLAKENVAPVVVRTEKRDAVDASGQPLFKPRATSLETVPHGERRLEEALYEAVTEYVRVGYDRAKREKRPAVGFLLLLMQRLVSSSTAAILAALERRVEVLTVGGDQLRLFSDLSEEWGELTGEEQYQALAEARGSAWGDEKAEVDLLLDLARKATSEGLDAKAEFLLALIRRLQRDSGDPSIKVVVFTEFVATQDMLLTLLDGTGVRATAINGSLSMEERALAQEEFREGSQVLVSTDAGGEGINLQFSYVVINYDLPWNPMRIEQRIGRVDRIGQAFPVQAFNLILENSVDARVLAVLETKLWTILEELGADKWGDVLESASRSVEDVYAGAILDPDALDEQVSDLASRTRTEVEAGDSIREMFRGQRFSGRGQSSRGFSEVLEQAARAFEVTKGEASADMAEMLERLPEAAAGESLPRIDGAEAGLWTLWEVTPDGSSTRDCVAVFSTGDGKVRPDLAESIWTRLIEGVVPIVSPALTQDEWDSVMRMGRDHAYAACLNLKPAEAWTSPWVTLRLAVRVGH